MIYRSRQQFGAETLRGRIENALGGLMFAATSLFFVGSAIGLFLKDTQIIA